MHPGRELNSKFGSPPPVRSLSFSSPASGTSSAAAAAAALVTIGGDRGFAAAAAANVEVLEPISDDERKRFQQLGSRNTSHAEVRVERGTQTRIQLTIPHYPLEQRMLAAFVNHLKVSKDRQSEQV